MNLIEMRLFRKIDLYRLPLAATVFCSFANGLLIVLQAFLLSQIITDVFQYQKTTADLGSVLFILLAVIAGRGVMVWAVEWFSGQAAQRVKTEIRLHLQNKLFKLGPAFIKRQFTGNLTTLLTDGIEALDAYIGQYLPQLAIAMLIPTSILMVVFPMDWISGVVLFMTAPLIPLFMILIAGKSEDMTLKQWEALSRLSVQFLDTLQGLTTLKTFNQSAKRGEIIAEAGERYEKATMNVLRVAFLSALVLELVGTISTAIIAVSIGLRLLSGVLPFREALFILFIAPEFYLPLRQLGVRFHAGMAGVTAARKIFDILNTPISLTDQRNAILPEAEWSLPQEFEIIFDRVQFSYTSGGDAVIDDFSFVMPARQSIAIVGASGAGKTTLFNLLLQFERPTQGVIRVNDTKLDEISAALWRNNLSWVPQFPYLFNRSIEENIRLAKPEAGMEEIYEAARRACLADFIHSLPDGYRTPVGEGGTRLSGGQAQRLALARAFLKDAPILLLDEPTAMLDPEQAAEIEKIIQKLCQGRTVLMIAHRLETVYHADQIIMMHNGRIAEAGNHNELIRLRGRYFQLVQSLEGKP